MFKFQMPSKWMLAGTLAALAASAQAFPDKSITLIVPFNAGTTTDVNARELAQVIAGVTRQAVVIDNRAGAEGTLGGRALLAAPPDGHTMLFTSSSLIVLDPVMKKNLPYDPFKDFTPVCTFARTSNVMNIGEASAHKTLAEVIAAAKAEPGKLTFAYTAATMRLAGELFQRAAGVKLTGVPYRSTVTALTDVATGRVDLVFLDHISATPFYQSGKLKPLAVSGAQRIKALPDVPSATEVGLPGYKIQPWFGIYASARTPPDTLAKVREAVSQSLRSPATLANLDKRGLEPYALCADEMARFQADELGVMRQVVKDANIEAE